MEYAEYVYYKNRMARMMLGCAFLLFLTVTFFIWANYNYADYQMVSGNVPLSEVFACQEGS